MASPIPYRRLLLILAMLAAFALPPTTLGQGENEATAPPATSSPIFGVQPAGEADLAPFRFELAAGEMSTATLSITNDGETVANLHSFAADISTTVNGGYTVAPPALGAPLVAAWITMPAEPLTIEPGSEVTVPLSVAVPGGTVPGEYMAAIATETIESAAMEGSDAFRQISRKVNAVIITVPGPTTTSFELGPPIIETVDGASRIIVPIENTGNTRVRPTGSIEITTAAGETVTAIPVAMNSVYAWHGTTIEHAVSPEIPPGDYLVTVELFDAASSTEATFSGQVTATASST